MPNNKNGFTLIELMVVIALIGILSAVVIPSIWDWREERVISDTTQRLQGVFQLARLAAIDENATVVVSFTPGLGAVGGVLAFVDDPVAGTIGSYDAGEQVVAEEIMPETISLVSAVFGGVAPTCTNYTRIGLPGLGLGGDVILANDTNDSYRRISLSPAGNLKTDKSSTAF